MYEAERGLFELRRRRALYVRDSVGEPPADALVLSAEALDGAALSALRELGSGPAHLVVTSHRARALGLAGADLTRIEPGAASAVTNGVNGHMGPKPNGAPSRDIPIPISAPTAIRLDDVAGPRDVLRLCSAPGRFAIRPDQIRPATAAEAGGLSLARLGHLLPAIVSVPVDSRSRPAVEREVAGGRILAVTTHGVGETLAGPRLAVSHVSEAPVPLQEAEDARFVLFREQSGLLEHVAILIGDREGWPDPVPVRLHSACLTGDLFGSLKCDCGEQLRGSLRYFVEQGGGVLLYLAQEGRGIGLGNKLRAYALQEGGLDTIDADCSLGFGADERSYDAALEMLRYLEVDRVRLLTNNPEKVSAVERGGVTVLDRRPLHGTLNRYNLPYVKAKVQRAGHWLGDMLSGVSENGK